MRKFLLLILVSLLSVHSLLGCSLSKMQLSKFDSAEYIFVGTVTGYVDNVPFKKPMTDAPTDARSDTNFGLSVRVLEAVSLPEPVNPTYQVFPYQLYADCSIGGANPKMIMETFPIGTEVRVVAKKAGLLQSNLEGNILPLEIVPGTPSSVSTNTDNKGHRVSSASSTFDYGTFNRNWGSEWLTKQYLPDFELRKDLLRLARLKSQEERNKILDRIVLAPPDVFGDFDIGAIFKQFTSNRSEFDHYFDILLRKLLTDEEFQKYKANQKANVEKPL